jgi:hypothetical protein
VLAFSRRIIEELVDELGRRPVTSQHLQPLKLGLSEGIESPDIGMCLYRLVCQAFTEEPFKV